MADFPFVPRVCLLRVSLSYTQTTHIGLITYADFLEEKLQLPKTEKDALKTIFVDAGQVGHVCVHFEHGGEGVIAEIVFGTGPTKPSPPLALVSVTVVP